LESTALDQELLLTRAIAMESRDCLVGSRLLLRYAQPMPQVQRYLVGLQETRTEVGGTVGLQDEW